MSLNHASPARSCARETATRSRDARAVTGGQLSSAFPRAAHRFGGGPGISITTIDEPTKKRTVSWGLTGGVGAMVGAADQGTTAPPGDARISEPGRSEEAGARPVEDTNAGAAASVVESRGGGGCSVRTSARGHPGLGARGSVLAVLAAWLRRRRLTRRSASGARSSTGAHGVHIVVRHGQACAAR